MTWSNSQLNPERPPRLQDWTIKINTVYIYTKLKRK
jgi:hypothetical protein